MRRLPLQSPFPSEGGEGKGGHQKSLLPRCTQVKGHPGAQPHHTWPRAEARGQTAKAASAPAGAQCGVAEEAAGVQICLYLFKPPVN